jgi:N6-adenosine-specific RNA methylase IME4
MDAETVALPYQAMSLPDIEALPVLSSAEDDAHLYLWTTQRFLQDSFSVAESWGFTVSATLVWCKAPRGLHMGGAFRSSVEFCHFCRRGNLSTKTNEDRRWFTWPRVQGPSVGRGEQRQFGHSAKPEAFIDMVERVSPGPYLEMFARRARFGWDYWGDQSLGTAELPEAV